MEISSISSGGSSFASEIGKSAGPTAGDSFGKVVRHFLQDTNQQQVNADLAVERLITGQTDNIHETMLALTQADMSFRMFMEVRNKMIDAYQEVIRTQV